MSIEIPAELKPVASLVLTDWPQANETDLRSQAERFDQMGYLLAKIRQQGDPIVKNLLASTEGKTHDAIDQFWKKFGGDHGLLFDAENLCHKLAEVLRIMAWLVIGVKLAIIAALIYFAVILAQALAMATPTLGASMAGAAGAQLSTRLAIAYYLRHFFGQVVAKTVVRYIAASAALGAAKGTYREVKFQSIEKAIGTRAGYDGEEIAHGAVHGAVAGQIERPMTALSEVMPVGGRFVKKRGKKLGDALGDEVVGSHDSRKSERIQENASIIAKDLLATYLGVPKSTIVLENSTPHP